MCTKTPKVTTPTDKPPVYLTNPLLSGLQVGAGTGRDSLRTDMPTQTVNTPDLDALIPRSVLLNRAAAKLAVSLPGGKYTSSPKYNKGS